MTTNGIDRKALFANAIASIETLQEHSRLYFELLYAVGDVHKGETRHETALRYIKEAEAPSLVASMTGQADPEWKDVPR